MPKAALEPYSVSTNSWGEPVLCASEWQLVLLKTDPITDLILESGFGGSWPMTPTCKQKSTEQGDITKPVREAEVNKARRYHKARSGSQRSATETDSTSSSVIDGSDDYQAIQASQFFEGTSYGPPNAIEDFQTDPIHSLKVRPAF